jgi:hypothetical protein
MRIQEYDYANKTTEELARILEWGTDMPKFEVAQRYHHIEAAASWLADRNEPEATEAVCAALRHVGAFHVNRMEGVYDDSESRLQIVIAGKLLRDRNCVASTLALLHAASSAASERIRYEATKSLVRRPVTVLEKALLLFMQEVHHELQASIRKHFLERFAKPENG